MGIFISSDRMEPIYAETRLFLERIQKLCAEHKIAACMDSATLNAADVAIQAICHELRRDPDVPPSGAPGALAHSAAILIAHQQDPNVALHMFANHVAKIANEIVADIQPVGRC